SPHSNNPMPLVRNISKPPEYLVDKFGASCFHWSFTRHLQEDCPNTRGVTNPNPFPASLSPFQASRLRTPEGQPPLGLGSCYQCKRVSQVQVMEHHTTRKVLIDSRINVHDKSNQYDSSKKELQSSLLIQKLLTRSLQSLNSFTLSPRMLGRIVKGNYTSIHYETRVRIKRNLVRDGKNNQSSSKDDGYQTKIITLNRENWVHWSFLFENFLTGRRHEDLLSASTTEEIKSPKFKKKNSSALALLWTCVSSDFHGVLLSNKGSFYDSWKELGEACRKNSIVIMCKTLFKLMSIQYEPGSSLEKHIDLFQTVYSSYKSITYEAEDKMEISSTIAAAFLIQSLNRDKELKGLVQILYNIKPFELTTVMNRVAVEHSQRGPAQEQALAVDKQKQADQSKPPTQGVHQGRVQGKGKTQTNPRNEEDSIRRLERLEKLFAKIDEKQNNNVNVVSESNKDPDAAPHSSDSDAFFLEDEVLNIGSGLQNQVYLDSGAGRSVVNNLSLLANIIKVNKQVNTYSDPVSITHQGTLSFQGIDISPVYYAPKGKVNLLSVSQVIDHGLKPALKGNSFLIMQGNCIVATFNKSGNLFASKIVSQFAYSFDTPTVKQDWHTILGHPSDTYIKKLINNKAISGQFTSSKECQVCLHAKLKRLPHLQSLPDVIIDLTRTFDTDVIKLICITTAD
ncbi:hypothetical protein O181_087866, partial [Austropuccinia psidii MF-1]|nr:hypothetical protein [Austropuccinia psidii MF-1]